MEILLHAWEILLHACFFFAGMVAQSVYASRKARKLREKALADKSYRDPDTGLPLRMNDALIRLRSLAKNGLQEIEYHFRREDLAEANRLGLIRYEADRGDVYLRWDLRKENELRMRTQADDKSRFGRDE